MLNQRFKQFILDEDLIRGEQKTLLAVSGGPDSVVLCHLFRENNLPFAIAHCNFRLRGKESLLDEEFTRKLAENLNVPFFVKRFNTLSFAQKKSISIQMAARELRYRWFMDLMKKEMFDLIATAHHRDDQAETFFINLLRGCGIAGLHGIPVRNGPVIRPMLFAGSKEILAYARGKNIAYRIDSSNEERYYLRNKIRHELIPLLRDVNPDFDKIITGTIARLAGEEEILRKHIANLRNELTIPDKEILMLDKESLIGLKPTLTYLYYFLQEFHFNQDTLEQIAHSLSSSEYKIFYSPTHWLSKDRSCLRIGQRKHEKNPSGTDSWVINDFTRAKTLREPLPLKLEKIILQNPSSISKESRIAQLDLEKIKWPLVVRKWKAGDRIIPLGMKGEKNISDYLTDSKVPSAEKEKVLVLISGDTIVWIIGYRIHNHYRIKSDTRKMLRIRLTNL